MEGGKFAEKPGELVGRALDGETRRIERAFDAQDRIGFAGAEVVAAIGRHNFEKSRGGDLFSLGLVHAGTVPAQLILQAGDRQTVIGAEIGLGLIAAVKGTQQSAPLFGGSTLGHPEA